MRIGITLASLVVVLVACGSSNRSGFDADPTLPGGPGTNGVSGDCAGVQCALGTVCVPGKGCLPCVPGKLSCVGNEVHQCDDAGQVGALVQTCDATKGLACSDGKCATACEAAASSQSNVGCEFWSVDLDLSDGVSAPGGGPWGLVLSNASQIPANVVVEKNTAAPGAPLALQQVFSGTVPVGQLVQVDMPQAITDCGNGSDDHAAPGTCLTSSAFRVTSTAPIVAYQFNNMVHNYSTDASLLLPTPVLGQLYRAIGWPSGSPFPAGPIYVQRTYVTVVGTQPGTTVTVNPSWRIKGHPPIAATAAGGAITATLGPFDVLNLESDDATVGECSGPAHVKPPYCTDLTGTIVEASAPVAVFSGTESSGVGAPDDAPKPPNWSDGSGCCKQHLEEQLPPLESIGKKFVLTRSPIRSSPDSGYVEPDVIRFVGAAATADVTTNLKAPFDHFTLAPGQILDAWTLTDAVITATEPILVAQFLVAQDYVAPTPKGDPSFTIVPPVEQQRNEYVFLSPKGWTESWVVVSAVKGTKVTIDGQSPTCIVADAGTIDGKSYEARRCKLTDGPHSLSGDAGFGIMAYGYNDADAYAFPGGAFVKKIYTPPPLH